MIPRLFLIATIDVTISGWREVCWGEDQQQSIWSFNGTPIEPQQGWVQFSYG